MNVPLRRLLWQHRLLFIVAAGVGITLLLMARELKPDARGFGTHEQLGLTPCYLLEITGYVCAMCGGTTAWAHLVRGQLTQAAQANLGATMLGLATLVGTPWLLFVAAWGRWPWKQPTLRTVLVIASVWLVAVGLDWLRRVYPSL